MTETEIECPFCGEWITLLVDTSVDRQSYVEDCSVCCRPIQVTATCSEGVLVSVEVDRGGA